MHNEDTHAESTSEGKTWAQVVEDGYLKRTFRIRGSGAPITKATSLANRQGTRSFVAKFGTCRVDSVADEDLHAWCATQPAYVVETVRGLFAWAHTMELISDTAMKRSKSRRGNDRRDLLIPSTADVRLLVAAAKTCWPGITGLRIGVLITLLAYCGLRPSEAFALRPQDLDLDRRRINVDGQLDEQGTRQMLRISGRRRVVMPPEAHTALSQLLPLIQDNDLLFRTSGGRTFNVSRWHFYWNPIRKSVPGLAKMHVYELRHYCATIMLVNDATPEQVARQLGHGDGGYLVRRQFGW